MSILGLLTIPPGDAIAAGFWILFLGTIAWVARQP